MKNALGKKESLQLYNDKGNLVYSFFTYQSILCSERTYNDRGDLLTFKNSDGDWSERTYDDKGNELTYKLSNGYWCESTYDDKGDQLTFKDSNGTLRGFDIPEYTMEELVEKLGNFKIKK